MTRNMPSAVRAHALQIARHEMGHYVIARALGFATGGVSLSVTLDLRHRGGAAITLARPVESMAVMQAHLEARMMVLFAGVMAQTLSSARVDKSKAVAILKGALGAEHDYAKIKELQHLLRNITFAGTDPGSSRRIEAELKSITDRIWKRTQTLVEHLADTITELASLLVDGMAIVEQWGRAADTYEVVFTRERLEALPCVHTIPVLET
ncbi:Peptidase M41 [Pseudomonas sp. IT-P12]|uniref:peptidase M41 n=1 Tax=Pseudomonas sp. IT-P12 TaxID=3026450 RepID=UPI0039E0F2F2